MRSQTRIVVLLSTLMLAELRREPDNEPTKTRIRSKFTAIRDWKVREPRAVFGAGQVSRLM